MSFDIKKERVRFRRLGNGIIKWEIPEFDYPYNTGTSLTPTLALDAVLDVVTRYNTKDEMQLAEFRSELARLESCREVLLAEIDSLEHEQEQKQDHELADMLEQREYFERALRLLEDDARFGPYRVKLVGIQDVGDTDLDKDLDFKVTLSW